MWIKETVGRKIFLAANLTFITAITITCVLPVWNVLCMSFSNPDYIEAGLVGIWPKGFNIDAYTYALNNTKFWTALTVTLKRIVIGVPLNLILVIFIAYPLSKSEQVFKARKYYVGFFVASMLFGGGMIPSYLVISKLKLIDSIWALILPGAVHTFHGVLLMNFFRSLPKEIEESALIDGAGHFSVMMRIQVPLSVPALATITLFSLVGHWNAWFDGILYMNYTSNYPLQAYLQIVVNASRDSLLTSDIQTILNQWNLNTRNMRAAQIFISMVPIMVAYPFLQKYFTTGIVMGSVKG